MLRVTVKEQNTARTVLLIEGDLVGDAVDILAEEGGPLVACPSRLVLDLAELRSISAAGLLLLRQWSESLTLRRPSHFVYLLLQQYGLEKCVEAASKQ